MERETLSHDKPSSLWSLLGTTLLAVALLTAIILVRIYIAKPFIVSGVSMFPTFNSWHYLIIDEFSYNFLREPARGEVVVFHYPGDPKRHFIKRIIGLPGETVELKGADVYISNGTQERFKLDESFIDDRYKKRDTMEITLGADEYFVLGDNRAESADSRYFGPLNRSYIVGRAFVRLFPFNKIEYLPGVVSYTETN